MIVCKRFNFDAAHRLPIYDGKCSNLHGHRWYLEVGVEGRKDENTGMVVDFGILKDLVKGKIIDKLDHAYLNELVHNPTAENLIEWIWTQVDTGIGYVEIPIKLVFLRLYESPDSYVEMRR